MKWARILSMLLAILIMATGLLWVGCSSVPISESGGSSQEYTALEVPAAGADVALVTTVDIIQGDFAMAAQTAIGKYAGEAGLTSGAYRVEGSGNEATLATLELAVKGGAELVVMLGAELAGAVAAAQESYPEVDFIFLGMGHEITLLDNGVRVTFSPEQGGWLAGYTAVREGYSLIGWMGDEDEVSQRAGLGYLLGAEDAAREMGLASGEVVALAPNSAGGGAPDSQAPPDSSSPGVDVSQEGQEGNVPDGSSVSDDDISRAMDEAEALAAEMAAIARRDKQRADAGELFARGVQVLFANIAGSQNQVAAAAAAEQRLMGYTLYGNEMGEALLVNIKYDPTAILQSLFGSRENDRFPGGTVAVSTVSDGGVGLDMAHASLKNVNQSIYEGMVDKLRFRTMDIDISRALSSLASGELPLSAELPLTLVALAPAPPAGGSQPASH